MPDFATVAQHPRQLALLLVAAIVAGLSRGFSGFGAALIFVPLASAAVGPRTAVPLLLAIDVVMAGGLLPTAWRRAERREVAVMAIGALVGVPAGTMLLTRADPLVLRWVIAGFVVAMLVLLLSGLRYRGRFGAGGAIGVGALSGFCSGAAQTGGPPVVAYWLGGDDPHWKVRANLMLYFGFSSLISVASYLASGLLTLRLVPFALLTAPAYGIGLYAGSHVFGLASERVFRRVSYWMIVAAAVVSLPLLDPLLR